MSRSVCTFVLTAALVCITPAFATNQRSFVSATGVDSNPCDRFNPCRNFAAAIAQTTSGGEVVALDSAGYGAIPPITQAISIIAPMGVHAAITGFPANTDTININASGSVMLRNIFMTGLGASNGIWVEHASTLTIDHCYFKGFAGPAIQMQTGELLVVADSVAQENGNGVVVFGSVQGFVSIKRSRFQYNLSAGVLLNNVWAVISDSEAIYNGSAGFGFDTAGAEIRIALENSIVSHNYVGIDVAGTTSGTKIRVSNCTVTANVTGISKTGVHEILSRGNNTLELNSTDGTFDGTYPAK